METQDYTDILADWARKKRKLLRAGGLLSEEDARLLALAVEFEAADAQTRAQISAWMNNLQKLGIRSLGVLTAFEIVAKLIHYVYEKQGDSQPWNA